MFVCTEAHSSVECPPWFVFCHCFPTEKNRATRAGKLQLHANCQTEAMIFKGLRQKRRQEQKNTTTPYSHALFSLTASLWFSTGAAERNALVCFHILLSGWESYAPLPAVVNKFFHFHMSSLWGSLLLSSSVLSRLGMFQKWDAILQLHGLATLLSRLLSSVFRLDISMAEFVENILTRPNYKKNVRPSIDSGKGRISVKVTAGSGFSRTNKTEKIQMKPNFVQIDPWEIFGVISLGL